MSPKTKPTTEEREGGACSKCGEPAELRRCRKCGETGWIIDCGHYDQPRPISAYGADSYCDDCFEDLALE
jgi:hypothetical protein